MLLDHHHASSHSLLSLSAGGVISYVGPCGGSPTRTSPVSMYSENSNSQPCFTSSSSSSSSTPSFLSSSSSSGSAGDDGSSSASSSAGGSPRGRDDGGSLRVSPSKSVASLTSKNLIITQQQIYLLHTLLLFSHHTPAAEFRVMLRKCNEAHDCKHGDVMFVYRAATNFFSFPSLCHKQRLFTTATQRGHTLLFK